MEKTWSLSELEAALGQFERDLRNGGYKDLTVHTYVDRSRRFLRYLSGSFEVELIAEEVDISAPAVVAPDGDGGRTSRDEILEAVRELSEVSLDGTFSPGEVVAHLRSHGNQRRASTINTMVSHFMAGNSTCESGTCPGTHTDDLTRVGRGRYRLNA